MRQFYIDCRRLYNKPFFLFTRVLPPWPPGLSRPGPFQLQGTLFHRVCQSLFLRLIMNRISLVVFLIYFTVLRLQRKDMVPRYLMCQEDEQEFKNKHGIVEYARIQERQ